MYVMCISLGGTWMFCLERTHCLQKFQLPRGQTNSRTNSRVPAPVCVELMCRSRSLVPGRCTWLHSLFALAAVLALVARVPRVHGLRLAWGVVNASGALPWSPRNAACVLPAGAPSLESCAAGAGMEWPPGVVVASRERLVVRRSGGVEIEAAGVTVEAFGAACVPRSRARGVAHPWLHKCKRALAWRALECASLSACASRTRGPREGSPARVRACGVRAGVSAGCRACVRAGWRVLFVRVRELAGV